MSTDLPAAIPEKLSCPLCGEPMKRVKWELTNGLQDFNVFLEVERIVLRCPNDNAALVLEAPTGKHSEYAPGSQ